MSYILSALKKVEHKRRSEQLPDLLSAHDEPAPPPAARRRTLLKTVVITGLLLAAGAWLLPSAGGQRTLAWLDEQWSSTPFSDWMPFTASSGDARRHAAVPHSASGSVPNKPTYKTVQVHEFSPLDSVAAVQGGRVKFPEPLAHVAPPPSAAQLAPLQPPRTAAAPAAAPPAGTAPVATPAAPPSSLQPPHIAAPLRAATAPHTAVAPAAAAPSPLQSPHTAALQPAPTAPAAPLLTPAPPATMQRAAPPPAAPPTTALLTPAPRTAPPAAPVDFDSLPPDTRRRIPAFSVTGHLYSDTRPQANKVIINGAALREGQYVNEDLMVSEITDAGVILDFRGLHFLIGKARIFQ